MLVEFLEPVYEDAKAISSLKHAVDLLRVKDLVHSTTILKEIYPKLCDICKRYALLNEEEAFALWEQVVRLNQTQTDTIYLADLIEYHLLPLLTKYMTMWGHIEEVDEGLFKLESTVSGFLTVQDIKRNIYHHSTIDPMDEARKVAEYIYEPEKHQFALLGCGLGYLPYQLYKLSRGSMMIYVYESNSKIIEYAYQFGVLSWIPEECITVIDSPDVLEFLNKADEEHAGFYMLFSELEMLPETIKPIMIELYLQYNTSKVFALETAINFWRNIGSDSRPISEFDKNSICEEVIVVAAGPSLDHNIEFLRENKGKKSIIAVGTVFRKLISLGIEPDVVTVLDPQERIYAQIAGLEEQQIPLIFASTAYWKIVSRYQGEKYMVFSLADGFARSYAAEHNEESWDCGGTVTSLAMQVAIWGGAKKIFFVGVDLAYQEGGATHAVGTMDCAKSDTKAMTPITGVGGTTVYADGPFLSYREWIEERIKLTPEIEYINMSKTGARIAGARENWQSEKALS